MHSWPKNRSWRQRFVGSLRNFIKFSDVLGGESNVIWALPHEKKGKLWTSAFLLPAARGTKPVNKFLFHDFPMEVYFFVCLFGLGIFFCFLFRIFCFSLQYCGFFAIVWYYDGWIVTGFSLQVHDLGLFLNSVLALLHGEWMLGVEEKTLF